jgi:cystathionine beta-synthase
MKERGISQVPVLEGTRLVGIVTETDLLTRMVEGRATHRTTIAEVMFRDVATVKEDEPASALAALFSRELVGLVVDDSGRLVSILTKMDVVDYLSGAKKPKP